jgi:lysine 2,3-aminomutase
VIVSGGDPAHCLHAAPRRASSSGCRGIPSIETIRLATRVPVTLPSRVTTELVRALRPTTRSG